MPRRRGRQPSRMKRRRGMGAPPRGGARQLRARGRKMTGGGTSSIPHLPDLPREARSYKHVVRMGGEDNSGRADLYVCPTPAHTDNCVQLNDHQKRIISNGNPYKG